MIRFILIAFALLGAPANAQSVTGNSFFFPCFEYPNGNAEVERWCLGYTMGVWEGLWAGGSQILDRTTRGSFNVGQKSGYIAGVLNICEPAEMSYGQMTSIFVNYLRDNPEKMNEEARSLFIEAMSEAFPCQ